MSGDNSQFDIQNFLLSLSGQRTGGSLSEAPGSKPSEPQVGMAEAQAPSHLPEFTQPVLPSSHLMGLLREGSGGSGGEGSSQSAVKESAGGGGGGGGGQSASDTAAAAALAQAVGEHAAGAPAAAPHTKQGVAHALLHPHTVFHMDLEQSEELCPELEVTPITMYSSDYRLNHGQQISVNSQYICYALKAGTIRVLNLYTASRMLLRGHTSQVQDLRLFSAEVDLLGTASNDGRIIIYRIQESGSEGGEAVISHEVVLALKLSAGKEQQEEGGGEEGLLGPVSFRWHTKQQDMFAVAAAHKVFVCTTTAFTNHQANQGEPLLFNINAPPAGAVELSGHEGPVLSIQFSPQGDVLASGGEDGCIRIWRVEDATAVAEIPAAHLGQPVYSLMWAQDPSQALGALLISGGRYNHEMKVWRILGESESAEVLQCVTLREGSAGVEESCFIHAALEEVSGLLVLANTLRDKVYTLRLARGHQGTPAHLAPPPLPLDCLAQFSVKMPILSFTTMCETVEEGLCVQMFCVQTKGIQQYMLHIAQCCSGAAPPLPEANPDDLAWSRMQAPASALSPPGPGMKEDKAGDTEVTPACEGVVQLPPGADSAEETELAEQGTQEEEQEEQDQEEVKEEEEQEENNEEESQTADEECADLGGSDETTPHGVPSSPMPNMPHPSPMLITPNQLLAQVQAGRSSKGSRKGREAPSPPPPASPLPPPPPPPTPVQPGGGTLPPQSFPNPSIQGEGSGEEGAGLECQSGKERGGGGDGGDESAESAVLPAATQDLNAVLQTALNHAITPLIQRMAEREEAMVQRVEALVVQQHQQALHLMHQEAMRRDQVEQERQARLMEAVSQSVHRDLPLQIHQMLRKELAYVAPHMSGAVEGVAARVEAGVVSAVQACVRSEAEAALQGVEAGRLLAHTFQSTLLPPLQAATTESFQQMHRTLQEGLHLNIQALQAHTQPLTAPLTSALADATALVSWLDQQQRNMGGNADRPMQKVISVAELEEKPLVRKDPTVELPRLVELGKYEEAFNMALTLSNLSTVIWLCNQVDIDKIFASGPPALSQALLWSLTQQLGCELEKDTAVKLEWLQQAVMAIDMDDALLGKHSMKVILEQLLKNLQSLSSVVPGGPLKNTSRLLIHLLTSLLSSN